MKMPQSPLNAIYEKEEEDMTETIRQQSERKVTFIFNSPRSINEQSAQVLMNVQLASTSEPHMNMIKESHHSKQSDDISVLTLKVQLSNKNEANCSRNTRNETNYTTTCLNLNTKDSMVIIPDKAICLKNNKPISYKEAFNYYTSYYLQVNVAISNKVKRNLKHKKHQCCFKEFLFKHMSRYKLNKELKSDKEQLLFIGNIAFDIGNLLHWKMIQTIYHTIKNNDNNNHSNEVMIEATPKCEDKQWEVLFDDNIPSFPIDKGGIYSMIQMMYLIEKYPNYFRELVQLLSNEKLNKNYIIAFLSSVSSICLEYVNNNELNYYFNQKNNILNTILDFYIGLIYQTHLCLTKQSSSLALSLSLPKTSETIHHALKKTMKIINKTPSSIFWRCKQFQENYTEEANSHMLSKSIAD